MKERALVCNEPGKVWELLESNIRTVVEEAITRGVRPGIFISGGKTYLPFYEQMGDIEADIFLTDDRFVPAGDPANSSEMVQREWFDRLVDARARFISVARAATVTEMASQYELTLKDWQSKGGEFVAAMLGLGKDGHTASLSRTDRSKWIETPSWVVDTELEQEPLVPRVTVTPSFLATIPYQFVVVTGYEKTEIVTRWLKVKERLPIAEAQPGRERLVILDRAAARDLPPESYQVV